MERRRAVLARQAEIQRQAEEKRKAEEKRREESQKNFAASLDKLFEDDDEPAANPAPIIYQQVEKPAEKPAEPAAEVKDLKDLSDIPEMKQSGTVHEPTVVPPPVPVKPAKPVKPADDDDDDDEDYDDDYDDDEYDDDEEEVKGHPVLRFLFTTLTVILEIQLAIFALGKFLPNSAISQTMLSIAKSVQDACDNFLANLIDKIVDLFHKGN